ncbi:hypothetical protein [Algoriphagus boritolerans]|uniref:hypothetical protein n=1 Tax=Algoriphagus boritolerans TaxID=308111 RepID=UPI002FCDF26B
MKKIMVLSEDSSPYLENSLGGPFLNFNLTKAYLASEKNAGTESPNLSKSDQSETSAGDRSGGNIQELVGRTPGIKKTFTTNLSPEFFG